ncbi:radical SAM protein [Pyrofollis japonicus]|uniref:radical SAM protein n=1 Tax=Pyrofollis japonicus TaxID=3060460 RepID=UPI00295BF7F2|nr:radical SAM protein [Pyrofollis japonicus]BEP17630.1 radical SAM protein [Pyrofollis japonicus]
MFLFERFVPEKIWRRLRPDAIYIWDNDEVRKRLKWYYLVMIDRVPAKFLLAKIAESPERKIDSFDLEQLLDLRRRMVKEHRLLVNAASREKYLLEDFEKDYKGWKGVVSLLDVDIQIVKKLFNPCRLCERRCLIDRSKRIGACRLDHRTYVHSWFHHLGEEAPLVPSGTIFYGGCNFTCVYCQNYDISQKYPRSGEVVTPRRLAEIQYQLRIMGARNINHVGGEPTPSLHTIIESFKFLDINVPQIWNSNMYMTLEVTEVLTDVIDLWLPDFKYGNNKCALRLSAVPRYFEVVSRNHIIASRDGDMIIRHLVLPGHVECCSKRIIRWIAENLPKDKVLVNIMDQYRPENLVAQYPRRWPELSRPVYREEVEEVMALADKLGIVYEPVSR